MAISSIGISSSNNYVLISSVTPTAATAAVNFTSLGLHTKFMLTFNAVGLATAGTPEILINNDSATDQYISARTSDNFAASNIEISGATGFRINSTAATTTSINDGFFVINNTDTTTAHFVEAASFECQGRRIRYDNGFYKASAVCSQINVVVSTTFNGTGTIKLYGVK